VRCNGFVIRYTVQMADNTPAAIDASVWYADRHHDGEPLFTLLVKWDGCAHLRMPYLHFDDLKELDEVRACIAYVYDDICAKHGVDG
jgi:hypothetical protein